MSENLENNKEKIEKPKRTLTQAQLDNLERMRKKKLLKSEARKMIEEQTKQTIINEPPKINSPMKDYTNDIEDMKKELSYISTYIKEKQNKKKEQKVESVATQQTNNYLVREPVEIEYEYKPVRNSLINGIIRR
jgi:hypothetical protein